MKKLSETDKMYLAGYYKAYSTFDILAIVIGIIMSCGLLFFLPSLFVRARMLFSAGLMAELISFIVSGKAFGAALWRSEKEEIKESWLNKLVNFLNWSVIVFYGLGYLCLW